MLILHQTGDVKVGEVVRYTLTYTPSLDRILPPPTHLHVKIKNTSAVPLRAAYLHGPYTLYVACYPSTYDPYVKQDNAEDVGSPDFEPQLKAGGHWYAKLKVPEEVRNDAERTSHTRPPNEPRKSFTWLIEVASQVVFSTTATVHFEVLVGRDERSVDLGFHGVVGSGQGAPGKLEDHQSGRSRTNAQPKGVFSKAVRLVVDDTESLWNTPAFPKWDDKGQAEVQQPPLHGDKRDTKGKESSKSKKPKKIHLVLLTHGLHSNLGADMLYMKESIDTAARQAKDDARKLRRESRARKMAEANNYGRPALEARSKSTPEAALAPAETIGGDKDDDDDDEEVLVRGFRGNAVKTEKGIQYLGKRFAKYVLSITYPDQPFLPVKSSISKSITRTFTNPKTGDEDGKKPTHKNSTIVKDEKHTNHNLPYKITSISFVGHSLGGLVQTYAIAYIQKHSPGFFDLIKPVNFVALATPFLGLSNENPVYVKFALDFGLVGRTGQDLGLTWRAPTLARKGWGAMMPGFGNNDAQKNQETNPGAKPLLRILPTGPAHAALKRFRNRTVYSNVVNDGIVPLRTSCLLFLDWRGLERVQKARRDNGLVGTMVEWGWAEMMGQNASAPRKNLPWNDLFGDSGDESSRQGKTSPDPGSKVPQADASQSFDEDSKEGQQQQFLDNRPTQDEGYDQDQQKSSTEQATTVWQGFLSFFKPQAGQQKPIPKKTQKIYRRGQTTMHHQHHDNESRNPSEESSHDRPGAMVRGPSLYSAKSENGEVQAPPKTTVFESAGDLLHPPLPPKEYLLDPSARPRTIFHDRVYHPDDIPAPPTKRQRTFLRRQASRESAMSSQSQPQPGGQRRPSSQHSVMTDTAENVGTMKIEEKIARAYHKDMSWRKVLVRLEPDAHNNMVVRRMFANAYGWPVVQHLCDTHFAYTAAALTADEEEVAMERAKPAEIAVGAEGERVHGQTEPPSEEQLEKDQQEVKRRSMPEPDRNQGVDSEAASTTEHESSPTEVPIGRKKTREDELKTRDSRTPSEIHESRDHITDLVSRVNVSGTTLSSTSTPTPGDGSYSSLTSKRALSNLARHDSARWSDQYFEGSDDEEEDAELAREEQYVRELELARRRGEELGVEQRKVLERWESGGSSGKGSNKSRSGGGSDGGSRGGGKSTMSTPSGASSKEANKNVPTSDSSSTATANVTGRKKNILHQGVVAEPDSMDPTEEEGVHVDTPSPVEQSPRSAGAGSIDQQILGLTGIGLGKSVEEQIGPASTTTPANANPANTTPANTVAPVTLDTPEPMSVDGRDVSGRSGSISKAVAEKVAVAQSQKKNEDGKDGEAAGKDGDGDGDAGVTVKTAAGKD